VINRTVEMTAVERFRVAVFASGADLGAAYPRIERMVSPSYFAIFQFAFPLT
jgi:hypothetical protein